MLAYTLPFLAFGLAFAITSLLLPQIINIANRYHLQDQPNERKVHKNNIPTFGGIAIFFGFLLATLVSAFADMSAQFQYLIGAILTMVIVGMRDDFLELSARWKFIGQVAAAFILVHFAEIHIVSLNGLFGLHELSPFVSYPLSMFVIVGITNAFNLIDGINGLAGTVSWVIFAVLGSWFTMAGYGLSAILCFSMVGAITGFLRFNYSPARIFMGDTGSLLLGFVISALIMVFARENLANAEVSGFPNIASPVSAGVILILYPAFDTFRVFIIRIREGRSPFSPDQNHIHHMLLHMGLSHMAITRTIVSAQVILVGTFLSLSCLGINENILVASMFLALLAAVGVLHYLHARHLRKAQYQSVRS